MFFTTLNTIARLTAALGTGPTIAALLILTAPVVAATLVLTWHGLRGTNPGPAANQLLKLVELVTFRRRTR